MKAPPYTAASVEVVRYSGGEAERDDVAVEEPLEIRVNGRAIAVTMRTPGHDEELALGFLLSEGFTPLRADVPADLPANTVDVQGEVDLGRLQRNFYTSSSCGVCGKGALEAVAVEAPRVESPLRVARPLVAELPERLRESQPAFAVTGGLHATGLFDAGGDCRSPTRSSASADACLSSSCRRRRWPAVRCSSLSERRRASRSTWRATAGSRYAASFAAVV